MAYLTVTTMVDVVAPGDGQLSLREALTQANGSGGPDTIRFAATVVGKTLVLTGGELSITDDVTIDGNNGGAAAQTTVNLQLNATIAASEKDTCHDPLVDCAALVACCRGSGRPQRPLVAGR
jgi:hypothetical protein